MTALRVDPLPVDAGYGGQVLLLRVAGEIDATHAHQLTETLTARTSHAHGTHVVLDLSAASRLSVAAARELTGWAARLTGRRVIVAGAPAGVATVLYETGAADVVALFPTLDDALARLVPVDHVRASREDSELRSLREQVRTIPAIARAEGVLIERYGLGTGRAISLLAETARHFALPTRVLAAAVLEAPRPASPHEPWFPSDRRPEAGAEFLSRSGTDPADREGVLDALLDTALHITCTANADVQLVDPGLGVLVLERQQGFSAEFEDFFAHVGDEGTACATAWRTGARVTVPDVATDPIFAGQASREVILDSGTRSVQSSPVIDRTGGCVGMISTHSPVAGRSLTKAEEKGMDALTGAAAEWITWYRRTIVLDALEHLHRLAGAAPPLP